MRNNLNVTFKLDRLICYDEADGWGSAEPYMWTIFFKIDGTTCTLNDALMLEGGATIFTTPGSHGNLRNNDVDGGDTVPIPDAIGSQSMILAPIQVPDFVKQAGTDDVAAIAGCIVVLMEEDEVSDDGAEAGHRALNAAVQSALDSIVPTLGFTNQNISDDDINRLFGQIQSSVEDAVKNQQNFFENILSWLNPDDTIGTVVWKFSGDELLSNNPVALEQRWPNEQNRSNDNGDWEIIGSIETEEIPSCPADVASSILDGLFGAGTSKQSMMAMYHFRDNEMRKYNGLSLWWNIFKGNSLYLKHALKDKEVQNAALALFKNIPEILSNKDKPLSKVDFDHAINIFKHISTLNEKDRHARKGIKRTIDALHSLKGKSVNEMLEILSDTRPARYPSKKV
jgi:hypothetical protein